MSTASTRRAWQQTLEQFGQWQLEHELSSETVRKRRGHLERFAAAAGSSPWQVSSAAVSAWADAGAGSLGAARARRQAVRAFYRWAYEQGHTAGDPGALLDRRTGGLDTPPQWAEAIDGYSRNMRASGHAVTSIRLRCSQLERFARAHAEHTPASVTSSMLVDWLGVGHWARETRKSMRTALVTFYDWAASAGLVESSPAQNLPRVRLGSVEPRPATEAAYDAALELAELAEAIALRLAAELGLRRAEVCQVHTRDLEESAQGWSLIVHGKGDKQRRMPLSESLAALLTACSPGYVFPGQRGGHMTADSLGRRVRRLLPGSVTMHALRHRFATLAYAESNDLFAVQQLLGHASSSTTQRYVRIGDDVRRRIVEQVSARSPGSEWVPEQPAVLELERVAPEVAEALESDTERQRVWISVAMRDNSSEWAQPVVWLRLENSRPGDSAGIVAGGQRLTRDADVIEQAETWAAGEGYALATSWQLTEAGAVAWAERLDGGYVA